MFLIALYAITALSAAQATPTRTFQADGLKFVGQDNAVCDIEGRWSDGQPFWYRAWDSCAKMSLSRVAPSDEDLTIQQVYGVDRTFVIPAGTESFIIGNEESIVQVFIDRQGQMQEITIRD